MSAPSIPNLLSLRGGTARGRGRGRGGPGRGGHSASGPGPSHDANIQGTDTDAAVSRLSAVDLGYLSDPFARLFVQGSPTRRLPIINRGTYTRTTAIDTLVNRFLATTNPDEPRQIVSLGAGTDTRCLRLFTSPAAHRNIAYHEIDFPAIMARKQAIISSTPSLRSILTTPKPVTPSTTTTTTTAETLPPPPTTTTWQTHSLSTDSNNSLTLHGLDLRSLTPSSPPLPTFLPTAPTLLLSECCLCYLSPAESTAVLQHFTTTTTRSQTSSETHPGTAVGTSPAIRGGDDSDGSKGGALALIIYEPILPHDPFGTTMTSNLAARGLAMPTLAVYPTPRDQEARLRDEAGLQEVRSATVDQIWDGWVAEGEKERVDRLEGGLDEVEEWRLLAGHYIVVWGWKEGGEEGGRGGLDLDVKAAKGGGGGGGLVEGG